MKMSIKVIALAILSSFVIVACQKSISSSGDDSTFDAQAAKEWYYGSFKKSPEWSSYNAAIKGKKIPDWKNGIYKKTGGREIVEFPLVSEKKAVTITNSKNITESDRRKIVDATINRIVFIKNTDGRIMVRELQYVPDMDYLAAHTFDISKNRVGGFDRDFSGSIVSKKWSGQETGRSILKSGTITGRFKTTLSDNNRIGSKVQACGPGDVEVTEWARDDEMHIYGDGMVTYEVGEWYPTGNVWCVGGDEVEENPACGDPSSNDCWCELIGCEEEGGGGEDCSNVSESLQGNAESEMESTTTDSETATTREKTYKWIIYKQMWNMYRFSSLEKGVHVKVNNEWRWQSLTHVNIIKTGGIIGGTVSCELNLATPTIGLYNASMAIDYTISSSAICNGSPFSWSDNFISVLYRNVND